MLQSTRQTIINEYFGKLPMGIFFTKACYIEMPEIRGRLID